MRYVEDRAVVIVEGEVDLASSSELLSTVRAALRRAVGGLALDLSGVTFLDSSGIQILVATLNAARAVDAPFTIASAPQHVRRVLEAAGLSELFGLRDAAGDRDTEK